MKKINLLFVTLGLVLSNTIAIANIYPIKDDDKFFISDTYNDKNILYPKLLAKLDLNPAYMTSNTMLLDYFNANSTASFRAVIRDIIIRDNEGYITDSLRHDNLSAEYSHTQDNINRLSAYVKKLVLFLNSAQATKATYGFLKEMDAKKIAEADFQKLDDYFSVLKKFKALGEPDNFDDIYKLQSLDKWYKTSTFPDNISQSFGTQLGIFGDVEYNKEIAKILYYGDYGRGVQSKDVKLMTAINTLESLIDKKFNHKDPLASLEELKPLYDTMNSYKTELGEIDKFIKASSGDINAVKEQSFNTYLDAIQDTSSNSKMGKIIQRLDAGGSLLSMGLGLYKNVSIILDDQQVNYKIKLSKLEQMLAYYKNDSLITGAIEQEISNLDSIRDSKFNNYIYYVKNNTLEFTKDVISFAMDATTIANFFYKSKAAEKVLGKSGFILNIGVSLADLYSTQENFKAQGSRVLAAHILSSIIGNNLTDDDAILFSSLFAKYAGNQLLTLYYWTPGYDHLKDTSTLWMSVGVVADIGLSATAGPVGLYAKSLGYLKNIWGVTLRSSCNLDVLANRCIAYSDYEKTYNDFRSLYQYQLNKGSLSSSNTMLLDKSTLLQNIVVSKQTNYTSILINEDILFNAINGSDADKKYLLKYQDYDRNNHIVGIRLLNNESNESRRLDVALQVDSSLPLRETAIFHDAFQVVSRNVTGNSINFKYYPFSDIRVILNNQYLTDEYVLQINFIKSSFLIKIKDIIDASSQLDINAKSIIPLNIDELVRDNSLYTFLSNAIPKQNNDKLELGHLENDKPWSVVKFSQDNSYIDVYFGKYATDMQHTVIDTLTNKTTDINFPQIDYKINNAIGNDRIINSAIFYETFKDLGYSKYINKVYDYIEQSLRHQGVTENLDYAGATSFDFNQYLTSNSSYTSQGIPAQTYLEISLPEGTGRSLISDQYAFNAKAGDNIVLRKLIGSSAETAIAQCWDELPETQNTDYNFQTLKVSIQNIPIGEVHAIDDITVDAVKSDDCYTMSFTVPTDGTWHMSTYFGLYLNSSGDKYTVGLGFGGFNEVIASGINTGGGTTGTVGLSPINDTGITACANASTNNLPCPQADFPGQDAEYGRDVTNNNDDSDGHAGFSYTKLDNNGNALAASATAWSCVKDNVTGFIWEVKTDDAGLRDKDWTYTWYNTNTSSNGGVAGTANGGSCDNATDCDTQKYLSRVNAQGLCGANDWRLPLKKELVSLVLMDRIRPSIDSNYFPNTISSLYWSASSYANFSDGAWYVGFSHGYSYGSYKSNSRYVRLVREGQ